MVGPIFFCRVSLWLGTSFVFKKSRTFLELVMCKAALRSITRNNFISFITNEFLLKRLYILCSSVPVIFMGNNYFHAYFITLNYER